MALPDYFIQELKSRCDIATIAESYVNLKRQGKRLLGLCPFHNEKTPSFNVSPENGYFHCFGCGAGGDVITFVMRIENLDYIEAVKFLAQRVGLQMPESGIDDSMSKLRGRVLEVNRETAKFYHKYLMSPEGAKGLDYFKRRKMGIKDIKHFGLGYSPESKFALVNHLKKQGFTNEEMVSANVAFATRNGNVIDRFHDRVMFPIIDLRGNVVAFGGRILSDEKPKYINTSDTPVYHKSQGLFAMNFAKNGKGDQLILAEGYMDVISLHSAGFENAIASLGTALTQEQARIISRYAKEVVICYDSDEAGQKAADRAIPVLRETGINVKVMVVPGNKDPDEFIKANGDEGVTKFKLLIQDSKTDIEYRLDKTKAKYNTTTNDGKVQFLTEACNVLSSVTNQIERDVYMSKLANDLSVEKDAINMQVGKAFKRNNNREIKKNQIKETQKLSAVNDRINPEKYGNLRIANAEEGIIAYLFHNCDAIDYVSSLLNAEKFATSFNKRVYKFILDKNTYSGEMAMMDFSGHFNEDELSAIAKILFDRDVARPTIIDADKYIEIINNEHVFSNAEKLKDMNPEEMLKAIYSMRDSKNNKNN